MWSWCSVEVCYTIEILDTFPRARVEMQHSDVLKLPSMIVSYFTSCAFEICMNHFELVHGDWKKQKNNTLSMNSNEFKLKWNFRQMDIFIIITIFIICGRIDWSVCMFKSIKMY